MTLTDIEYKTFLKTHIEFLFYVGQRSKIISSRLNFKEFVKTDFLIKLKCQDYFLDNKKILDDYIITNFGRLTANEISILTDFKKTITSEFVILKCLTSNAIFINKKNNRFYAVKALGDGFDRFFDTFPVLVYATILPFKDHIIYDGFIKSQGIIFGSEEKSTMNKDYNLAKTNNQILTRI